MSILTPQELLEFTTFEEVKTRPQTNLQNDIVEAESEMKSIIGHDFSDNTLYPNGIPDDARLAYLKMAQFYALINGDESLAKGYQSESIGDYSYSLASGETIRKPDVYHLVSEYVKDPGQGRPVTLRMYKL